MAVDETSRLRLFDAARRTLGEDEAETLMSGLAPSGIDWTHAATKSDLRELEERLEHRLERTFRAELTAEVGSLEARMLDRIASQTRALMLGMVASQTTLAGLVLAAVRLGA